MATAVEQVHGPIGERGAAPDSGAATAFDSSRITKSQVVQLADVSLEQLAFQACTGDEGVLAASRRNFSPDAADAQVVVVQEEDTAERVVGKWKKITPRASRLITCILQECFHRFGA
jgi:hypothetical protein